MTTVNKTELAGVLAALGKLVCRTSPILVYRAAQIEATTNALLFRTHNLRSFLYRFLIIPRFERKFFSSAVSNRKTVVVVSPLCLLP